MSFFLVYARASSDPNDQRISVDRQVKLCTARGLDLWPDAEARPFRDDNISAAKPGAKRPGFDGFRAAVRGARKGELVGVVVNEQSRLTRLGDVGWKKIAVMLDRAGLKEVQTLNQGPVSIEEGNRLLGGFLALIDEEEVARTRKRVRAAHSQLFEEGRPSGRAPFGYRSVERDKRRHFEPDPVESAIVADVFAWALEGHALATIAARLNDRGIAPRSASFKYKDGRVVTEWSSQAVRHLLVSPQMAALRPHTDDDGQLHVNPAKWDPIVDEDTWSRVQRLLGRPSIVTGVNGESYRVRTKPAAQPRHYLLSGGRRRSGVTGQPGQVYGVLRCGRCGAPLVAQTQGRRDGTRVPAYSCHPSKTGSEACGGVSISPADEVERLVVDAIQKRLAKSPKLRARLNAAQDVDAARWRAQRDAAKTRMLAAGQLLGEGTIDRDVFDTMHGAAKAEYDTADARLAAVATDVALPSADDVIERWETLTLAAQRAVVERLIERIDVAPGNLGHPGFNPARLSRPTWRA
jgi:DNA invertase Pin-like site-specific DNA recombinase